MTPGDEDRSNTVSSKKGEAVSICAAFFGEELPSIEAREFALALASRGIHVHLKPRWLEETGVQRADRS